jgi:hypothetical protein
LIEGANHSFSWHRGQLVKTVVTWLQKKL